MKFITLPVWWDRATIAIFAVIMLTNQTTFAQQKQLIIKATSSKVDLKDGDVYQKGIWDLSAAVNPDIYYTLSPINEKRITFYTDIDSISFNIVPGNIYNFIILLNNKVPVIHKYHQSSLLRRWSQTPSH